MIIDIFFYPKNLQGRIQDFLKGGQNLEIDDRSEAGIPRSFRIFIVHSTYRFFSPVSVYGMGCGGSYILSLRGYHWQGNFRA